MKSKQRLIIVKVERLQELQSDLDRIHCQYIYIYIHIYIHIYNKLARMLRNDAEM